VRRSASLAALVGLGFAVGSPFLLGGSELVASLRAVTPRMILIMAGLALVSGVAKAGKLQVLLASLGERPVFLRTLAISLATDFAFLSSPAGAAGYVVNLLLLRSAGTSWIVATAAVSVEQALDLVFFAAALPVAALAGFTLLAQVVPSISRSAYAALLTFVAAASCGLWLSRHRLAAALRGIVGANQWFRVKREGYGQFLRELRTQLGALLQGDVRRNLSLLLLTTLQWLARYGALWAALAEVDHRLPFAFILVLQAVVLHLAQWTGIPAGGGSADLALAAVLAPWVPGAIMATVLMLWRFATLYCPLIAGGLSLVALSGSGWLTDRRHRAVMLDLGGDRDR